MKLDETVPGSGCRMQQLQSHKVEDDFSAAFQSQLVGDGLLVSFTSSLSKGFLSGMTLASCLIFLTQASWHLSQYQSRSDLDHLVTIMFIAFSFVC